MPKISIVVPSHTSPYTAIFLSRLFSSLVSQSFTDYEVVLCQDGSPGKNINDGIRRSKGEIIKILCQDDWFTHPDSLKDIVENFKGDWMITGSHNNPHPYWNDKVPYGFNTLGGLSTIVMKNKDPILFDENLVWMIDVEFYKRAFEKWGVPQILDSVNVNIGIHPHQATNLMTLEEKLAEHNVLEKRYNE